MEKRSRQALFQDVSSKRANINVLQMSKLKKNLPAREKLGEPTSFYVSANENTIAGKKRGIQFVCEGKYPKYIPLE